MSGLEGHLALSWANGGELWFSDLCGWGTRGGGRLLWRDLWLHPPCPWACELGPIPTSPASQLHRGVSQPCSPRDQRLSLPPPGPLPLQSPGPSPAPCLDSQCPPPQARPEPKIWKWAGKGKSWRLGPSLGLSGWMGVADRVQERNAEVERGGGGNLESLTLDTWSITACFRLFTEYLVCASHYPTLHSLSPQSRLVLTASL